MKSSQDPRHQNRIHLMQQLFSASFRPDTELVHSPQINEHLPEIDSQIQIAAPEWPLVKIAKIDLAILRLAVFELTVDRKQPPKVIIDEAVELGKEFGNQNSPQFINGVLGTILKKVEKKEQI